MGNPPEDVRVAAMPGKAGRGAVAAAGYHRRVAVQSERTAERARPLRAPAI
jgi:hypothetical protein